MAVSKSQVKPVAHFSTSTGMAIEEISRLVGHSSSNVTETVYRHQIRPVITVGAEAMDKIFANE
jgi:integrase